MVTINSFFVTIATNGKKIIRKLLVLWCWIDLSIFWLSPLLRFIRWWLLMSVWVDMILSQHFLHNYFIKSFLEYHHTVGIPTVVITCKINN